MYVYVPYIMLIEDYYSREFIIHIWLSLQNPPC